MRKFRIPATYPLSARVWLAKYDPEEIYDFLTDEVDTATLRTAIRMANEWLYQRSVANWDAGLKLAVEKALEKDEPERFNLRRLAFVRHVLSTIAGRYPELVQNLTDNESS